MANQIEQSLAVLEELKKKTTEEVTDFRVKSDLAEDARRRLEEERRLRRYDSVEVEAVQTGRKQAKIELNWQNIMQINVPHDLHAALEQQKAEAHSVVAKKERQVIEFSAELREKDDEFVKSVNDNNKDVKGLIETMHKQYHTMRAAYKDQLEDIEKSFLRERMEILDTHKQKIESLFATRKAKEEVEYMAERKERLQQFRNGLSESRARDLDQFSRVKLQHELAIQDLEQHWARMNATYHLNREKLDYNSQILAERHKEFQAIINAYRQRISRLRTALNTCMATYHEQDKQLKATNEKVTGEYKRLTRQVKDLQKKLADFSSVAEKQFKDAWNMHVDEVDKIAHKVYEADKVICEQQLCLVWEPPNVRLQREREMRGDGVSEYGGGSTFGGRSTARGSEHNTKATSKNGESSNNTNGGEYGNGGKYSNAKYDAVMAMIVGEADFLIDGKVRIEISALEKAAKAAAAAANGGNNGNGGNHHSNNNGGHSSGNHNAVVESEIFRLKVRAMESYLGIEEDSPDDRDLLISYFTSGGDDEDDDVPLEQADECLAKLKMFLAAKNEQRLNNVAPTSTKGNKKKDKNGKNKNNNNNNNNPNDEATKRELERRWWQDKSMVLPDVTIRVWKALDNSLSKYYSLLEQRANVLESNVRLQKQNEELMVLLDQYIHSRVNEELKIPPKHVIKVV